jgi:AcrR family transcriptional regulator
VRAPGTRVRAGNAMARTRSSVLRAAVTVAAERGTRRVSMADVAAAAGIAKGTLYNHFRTKDDVWAALVHAEVEALVDECRGLPLVVALGHAAQRIGAHPAVRRIAADEPAVLAALVTPTPDDTAWTTAREAVGEALAAAGKDPAAKGLVLRWLASHLTAPDPTAASTAELLAAALPPAASGPETAAGSPARPASPVPATGPARVATSAP